MCAHGGETLAMAPVGQTNAHNCTSMLHGICREDVRVSRCKHAHSAHLLQRVPNVSTLTRLQESRGERRLGGSQEDNRQCPFVLPSPSWPVAITPTLWTRPSDHPSVIDHKSDISGIQEDVSMGWNLTWANWTKGSPFCWRMGDGFVAHKN